MIKKLGLVAAALTIALSSQTALAKVSADEAAKLGDTLTPLGAEKAGNADGSIPSWEGGITTPPAGFEPGGFHIDPFPEDKPLFEITGANYQEYADFLSDGQKKMFATYPGTYRMPVYQTRRTASNPQEAYDATKANATRAELLEGGNGIKGAAIGIPFPIPQNGLEAIWNHVLRYRGEAVARFGGQAAVTASGDYNVIGFDEELLINYSKPGVTPEQLVEDNILFMFKQKVTKPARLAGTALLVHETVDQIKQPRKAWTYNTGQRRVRLAPNIAYDTPGTAADGLRTTDDFDMFNGSPNRYNWELKGKQELYIAYNNYALHSDKVSYADILTPNHVNPDLTRFEKHRVWVVEATLKEEFRHVYQKRVFYIDEDTWQATEIDHYDGRGQLWRVAEAHNMMFYDTLVPWYAVETLYDLNSGRYLVLGLDNEESGSYEFGFERTQKDYTPAALRRSGRR